MGSAVICKLQLQPAADVRSIFQYLPAILDRSDEVEGVRLSRDLFFHSFARKPHETKRVYTKIYIHTTCSYLCRNQKTNMKSTSIVLVLGVVMLMIGIVESIETMDRLQIRRLQMRRLFSENHRGPSENDDHNNPWHGCDNVQLPEVLDDPDNFNAAITAMKNCNKNCQCDAEKQTFSVGPEASLKSIFGGTEMSEEYKVLTKDINDETATFHTHKVTLSAMAENFRKKICDREDITSFYHGTRLEHVNSILTNGFHYAKQQNFGPGVYFGHNFVHAASYGAGSDLEGSEGAIIEVHVLRNMCGGQDGTPHRACERALIFPVKVHKIVSYEHSLKRDLLVQSEESGKYGRGISLSPFGSLGSFTQSLDTTPNVTPKSKVSSV